MSFLAVELGKMTQRKSRHMNVSLPETPEKFGRQKVAIGNNKAPAKSLVKVWTLNPDEKIRSLLVDGAGIVRALLRRSWDRSFGQQLFPQLHGHAGRADQCRAVAAAGKIGGVGNSE